MSTAGRNIVLMNLSKSWGGGEKWFFITGKELIRKGWNVQFLVYPDSALHGRIIEDKLPFTALKIRFSSLLNPFRVFQLFRFFRKAEADILLLNASHELKTGGLLGKWAGIPQVILRRGLSYPFKDNPLNHWYIDRVLTAFLTNSEDSLKNFAAVFPQIRKKPLAVIRNGVDASFYQPHLQGSGHIGIAARLSPEKGIDLAIEAMAKIKHPNALLHIWGEGPEEAKLKTLVHSLNLGGRVSFHGFSSEVQKELACVSIFLMPSLYGEGTSNSLVEAMALGLPAVVFDVDSMKENVVDGLTGFVVENGNTAEMAAKIQWLIENEEERQQMGKAGRRRCMSRYSLEERTEELIEWINELFQNRRG